MRNARVPDPSPVEWNFAGPCEFAWEWTTGAEWVDLALALVELQDGVLRGKAVLEQHYRDIAHYARMVYRFNYAQTEEVLRVGRRLLELPYVARALGADRLTWRQVVLLTRVAVPACEMQWLKRALEVPLDELARQVARGAMGWAPPVALERPSALERGCVPVQPLRPHGERERVRRAPSLRLQSRLGAPNVRRKPGAPPPST